MPAPTDGGTGPWRRMLVDGDGTEWELYDDAHRGAASIDWDVPAEQDTPGLYFVSVHDLRRIWPAPARWWTLGDEALLELCRRATSVLR